MLKTVVPVLVALLAMAAVAEPARFEGDSVRLRLADDGKGAFTGEMTYNGAMNTWDYQMFLAAWANNLLSIIPNVNLITNIGFGPSATHTRSEADLANVPLEAMAFPLRHPLWVIRDARSDEIMRRAVYAPPSLARKIRRRLKKWF